ncbi:CBS domain-containing protein [Pedobacter sp. SYSU D00535]|uniref:CBS domain-containing protein n=1 Tax=Pedobacter sp. SYSU D00535 TaxID=2810308 RepID=UPI001A958AD4|nr:CBS domain-containing protein [Pedobacter sp. SYSU D00535]
MIARELIADIITPVVTSDTIQKVMDRMNEFRVSHLPIVEENQLVGVVSDDDLIETPDFNTLLGDVNLSLNNACVNQNQHIYDVIRLFYDKRLSLVPVLDDNKNYLGVISANALLEHFASITAVKEPGGIIVLEISNRNNSLAHIAQIVESNNAQVLSSYINSFADSTKLEVTLKVNRTDVSAIVASFGRYDYNVIAVYSDQQADQNNSGRYDQLMNYLNI